MTERYTIISADSHAGGNMAMYEEYLADEWKDEFKEWRGDYSNPYRDLQDDGRTRNWDNERRVNEQYEDGVVADGYSIVGFAFDQASRRSALMLSGGEVRTGLTAYPSFSAA